MASKKEFAYSSFQGESNLLNVIPINEVTLSVVPFISKTLLPFPG
jgi:hypothetical protein